MCSYLLLYLTHKLFLHSKSASDDCTELSMRAAFMFGHMKVLLYAVFKDRRRRTREPAVCRSMYEIATRRIESPFPQS